MRWWEKKVRDEPMPQPFDVTKVREQIMDAAAVTAVNLCAALHRNKTGDDPAARLELGLLMGHMYVVLGHVMDHGLVDQRDCYHGRLQAGERLKTFMDRFPLENGHPPLDELFKHTRRQVK